MPETVTALRTLKQRASSKTNRVSAMACNASTCQSNCYKDEDVKLSSPVEDNKPISDANNECQTLCIKCKANEPISISCGGGDCGLHCADCFRANLFGKFRLSVTSHAMITPSDNVLVAFSGGPASRVALQFVHELQDRAQKNFNASRDRSLPVFGVGVAFVDETCVHKVPDHGINEVIEEMRLTVTNLSPPIKKMHIVPIESVYSSDSEDGRDRLRMLLDGVSDATGKEDLLLHLRMLCLQKLAVENGYNRIVVGSCTSRIACHFISATVKGQGYSLSADIQYVDARWQVPIVLPLRDCLIQEINTLCHLDGLKTRQVFSSNGSGINGLVSSFVKLLQEENPSRECTIVRTGGKLIPFHFNRIPEINDSIIPLATQRRQKRFNVKPSESISSESFCPICNSPLNKSDLPSWSSLESYQRDSDVFGASCCSSCRFQILPKDSSSTEHFLSLLPEPLIARTKLDNTDKLSHLREQIQDFLLSDGEVET